MRPAGAQPEHAALLACRVCAPLPPHHIASRLCGGIVAAASKWWRVRAPGGPNTLHAAHLPALTQWLAEPGAGGVRSAMMLAAPWLPGQATALQGPMGSLGRGAWVHVSCHRPLACASPRSCELVPCAAGPRRTRVRSLLEHWTMSKMLWPASCRRTSPGGLWCLRHAGLWSCAKRRFQARQGAHLGVVGTRWACSLAPLHPERGHILRRPAEQFWSTEALGMGIFYTLNVFIMQFYLGRACAAVRPAGAVQRRFYCAGLCHSRRTALVPLSRHNPAAVGEQGRQRAVHRFCQHCRGLRLSGHPCHWLAAGQEGERAGRLLSCGGAHWLALAAAAPEWCAVLCGSLPSPQCFCAPACRGMASRWAPSMA